MEGLVQVVLNSSFCHVFYWNQLSLVGQGCWDFLCSVEEKPFSVGLVDQLIQPSLKQVETVERAFA